MAVDLGPRPAGEADEDSHGLRLALETLIGGEDHRPSSVLATSERNHEDAKRLEKRIRALIRQEEDDVRLYLLCDQCVPRIRPLGKAEVAPEAEYRIL